MHLLRRRLYVTPYPMEFCDIFKHRTLNWFPPEQISGLLGVFLHSAPLRFVSILAPTVQFPQPCFRYICASTLFGRGVVRSSTLVQYRPISLFVLRISTLCQFLISAIFYFDFDYFTLYFDYFPLSCHVGRLHKMDCGQIFQPSLKNHIPFFPVLFTVTCISMLYHISLNSTRYSDFFPTFSNQPYQLSCRLPSF